MIADLLAPYLHIPVGEFERLISLSPEEIYQDPTYQHLVAQLDQKVLSDTLPQARDVYEVGLPAIKDKFGWSGTVMSGYTLCNWVIGFLRYPEKMKDMLPRHERVASLQVADALPELASLLDALPEGREEWQRALIVFSLPLLAKS